ncbi:hypothetical protein [Novosphingobium sp. ZW T3_23]
MEHDDPFRKRKKVAACHFIEHLVPEAMGDLAQAQKGVPAFSTN